MSTRKRRTPKRRARGGASVPCPRCRGPSRVLRTARINNKIVARHRECKKKKCRADFWTEENTVKKVEAVKIKTAAKIKTIAKIKTVKKMKEKTE